jgi:hypothetical protein
MFDHAVEERFLKPENRALVLARDKPAELLHRKMAGLGDALNRQLAPKLGRTPIEGSGMYKSHPQWLPQ